MSCFEVGREIKKVDRDFFSLFSQVFFFFVKVAGAQTHNNLKKSLASSPYLKTHLN